MYILISVYIYIINDQIYISRPKPCPPTPSQLPQTNHQTPASLLRPTTKHSPASSNPRPNFNENKFHRNFIGDFRTLISKNKRIRRDIQPKSKFHRSEISSKFHRHFIGTSRCQPDYPSPPQTRSIPTHMPT